MARRRLEGLERVLGVNALFSTAYGNVGSSIYYALGLVAALALGLTPVVFILTGALFYCTATTYAEATAMFPEAGGSSLFVRRAFNEFWSFFTAWAQMLNYVITIAISAYFAAGYFGGVAGGWTAEPGARVAIGVGLITLLALVNVRGVKDAVAVNVVLAVVDFLSQLALVVLGAVLLLDLDVLIRNLSFFGTAPTWQDFLIAIPVGTVAYTGIETISNMAGEARDEAKTIPAAIKRVMIAVFTIYFTLPWVALSALPVRCDAGGECTTPLGVATEDGGFADNPILGIVSAMELGAVTPVAEIYVGVLAVTILVAATNAGVLGVSRLVYSMGMHRQMPDGMRRLHPRFRTPYLGILAFSAIAALALLPGQADFLGAIYAFGAMLSFSMAHLAVLRLRVTQPGHERPYRSPGRVRVRGHELPPFALLGLAGTASSLLVVSALDLPVAAAGTGWLLLGVVTYVAYRRRQGLDLVSTYKVAIPEPVVDHEAEYDSVLVHVGDGRFDEQLLATAAKLAAQKRRGIHVLVTITVPHAHDIDAPMPEEEATAASIVEQAKLQGGRRVSGHWEKVRAGQAGRRIIEEAQDMRAAAVVLGLPRRIPGASIFGSTLEAVLAERPCRVVIESRPEPVRRPPRA
ncbi:MAG TPA: universal stress protein [Solirubrobacteraceae bacterium]|jgi:APA family basic amino acid/polyamine antiporter|nr:universal stress protein [Solirubrobacteraceae bacterium]